MQIVLLKYRKRQNDRNGLADSVVADAPLTDNDARNVKHWQIMFAAIFYSFNCRPGHGEQIKIKKR